MSSKLVVTRGPEVGTTYYLKKKRAVIGRAPDADIRIDQEGVSRRHCEIWTGPRCATIEDLGSRNGSFLNGSPVSTAPLYHGDLIAIGPLVLEFRDLGIRNPQDTDAQLVTSLAPALRSQIALGASRQFQALPLRTALGSAQIEDRIEGFFEVAAFFARPGLEESEIIEGFANRAREAVDPDRLVVFLAEAGTDLLAPVLVQRGEADRPGQTLELSDELVRRTVAERVAILAEVVPDSEAAAPRSALCVPLSAEAELLAAIYLDRDPGRPPLEEGHLHAASAIARLAALSLERLRQRESLERRVRDLASSLGAAERERDSARQLLAASEAALVLLAENGAFIDASPAALERLEALAVSPIFEDLVACPRSEPWEAAHPEAPELRLALRPLERQQAGDPAYLVTFLEPGAPASEAAFG